MTEIREIRSTEYDFLREMLYEALFFPDEREKPPTSVVCEPHLSKYVENFGRRGDSAFVLVDESTPVGAVWTRLFTENDPGYGFIDGQTPELSIALRADFRNRGFGGLLLEKMLEALKINGFEKVSLSVDKQNRAVNLYQRAGFTINSEHGTALTMLKIL